MPPAAQSIGSEHRACDGAARFGRRARFAHRLVLARSILGNPATKRRGTEGRIEGRRAYAQRQAVGCVPEEHDARMVRPIEYPNLRPCSPLQARVRPANFYSSKGKHMDVLRRPHLVARVVDALQVGHVTIVAPAGYGKSSLARALCAERPGALHVPLRAADADPRALAERIADLEGAPLVFDDVHHLDANPDSASVVGERLSDGATHVLCGRHVPTALEHLTAGIRLGPADLAFAEEETRRFLADQPNLGAEWSRWHERTGGWPLALGMIKRGGGAITETGVEGDLFAHLAARVMAELPERLREAWLRTALARTFDDELARFLIGGDPKEGRALVREIERRGLFVEATDRPGWRRYHELIRRYLLDQAPPEVRALAPRLVAWLESRGEREAAIEHAIEFGLHRTAARLVEELPPEFSSMDGRFYAFRRWAAALPEDELGRRPFLLQRLVQSVHYAGLFEEAERYLALLQTVAAGSEDDDVRRAALLSQAEILYKQHRPADAMAALDVLLADPGASEIQRAEAWKLSADAHMVTGQLRAAARAYVAAIGLADRADAASLSVRARYNLAIMVRSLLGELDATRLLIDQIEARLDGDSANGRLLLATARCELMFAGGEAEGYAAAVREQAAALAEMDEPYIEDLAYHDWNAANAFLLAGDNDAAEAALLRSAARGHEGALYATCVAWTRAALARRAGNPASAVDLAEEAYPRSKAWPAYRALLVLEAEVARQAAGLPAGRHAGAVALLVRSRSRTDTLRLRALLALRHHAEGNAGWRRHARALPRRQRADRRGYGYMERVDPPLSCAFWRLALVEGEALAGPTTTTSPGDVAARAEDALCRLADTAAALALLTDGRAALRSSAARILGTVGGEEAMVPLHAAINEETSSAARATMADALHRLENAQPPPLDVRLLGNFVLRRDGVLVPGDAWYRPIVRRVFQYLVLQRGVALPRDRVLEDLWPDTDPAKAWTTLRTVLSRIRALVDPHMRPKGPSRYLEVQGDMVRFDPHDVVSTDVVRFEQLAAAARQPERTKDGDEPSAEFMAALDAYDTLLPELPYELWVMERRERLAMMHADGCLRVAQVWLQQGDPERALTWSDRATLAAPWSEEAHVARVQALARSGQRDRALRTCREAIARLGSEGDAGENDELAWLAERLERGEHV